MDIRPSAIAGTWYPGDPQRLSDQIDGFLAQAQVEPPHGRILGAVVPHAGYRYSGPVAAHAFRCLQGCRPDLVVILAPMHTFQPAGLLTTAHAAYATPLGVVKVDRDMLAALNTALRKRLGFGLLPLRHDVEHALEIELPFLQRVLPRPFRLLPVMLLDQRTAVVEQLGLALAELLHGRNVLLVASSDLSHFYPQDMARDFDRALLQRLAAFDPRAVMAAEAEGVGFACGRGAIAAVLWAARELGANRVTIARYATSGDVSGDFASVVGYGAAVIWQDVSGRGDDTRLN